MWDTVHQCTSLHAEVNTFSPLSEPGHTLHAFGFTPPPPPPTTSALSCLIGPLEGKINT